MSSRRPGYLTSRARAHRIFGTSGTVEIHDDWGNGYVWESREYRACKGFGGSGVRLTVDYETGHKGGGMRAWYKDRATWW